MRYGVRSGPGVQIDFSVVAASLKTNGAIATAGSPQEHVFGLNIGPAFVDHVRPPFTEVKTRISGSTLSFAAATRSLGLDGSTATATSVWIPRERETSCPRVPAACHGLFALCTVVR